MLSSHWLQRLAQDVLAIRLATMNRISRVLKGPHTSPEANGQVPLMVDHV